MNARLEPNDGGNPQPDPTAAEVRAALARVLGSRCFEQAGRASEFLRFTVEQTLAGHGRNLKGYVIATAVFGRSEDFDPQVDPLVRVEAGRLRRRLTEYYATEGSDDPVRITLPRGHYAPEWRRVVRELPPTDPVAADQDDVGRLPNPPPANRWRHISFVLAAALVASLGTLAWQPRTPPAVDAPPTASAAPVAAAETDRFPIVVTPFVNLSGEPELDRWAGALTEEILVRLDSLEVLVIASPDSWPGAGAALGTEQGGYVLTGSIRSAGDTARITVRLIEAASGALLWSAPYSEARDWAARPALHERMALEIAAAAAPYGPLYEAELERARRAANQQPGLRDCFASYYEYRRRPGPENHGEALRCFESVTVRRPELANGWAGLGLLYTDAYGFHYDGAPASTQALLVRAASAIDTAKSLDPYNAMAELANARQLFFVDYAAFLKSADRVLEMNPDGPEALAVIGVLLALSGNSERGLPLAERAIELTPDPPGFYEIARAVTRLREGDAEEALDAALHIGAPNWYVMPMFVAAAAGVAGREDVAKRAGEQLLRLDPDFASHALDTFNRWRFDQPLSDVLMRGLAAAGVVPMPVDAAPADALPSGGH